MLGHELANVSRDDEDISSAIQVGLTDLYFGF